MKKGMLITAGTLLGTVIGGVGVSKLMGKSIEERNEKVDKFKGYYNLLNQWLILKQEGKNLNEYFVANNINSIAIYGMGELGNRLYTELKESSVRIEYVIDQNVETVIPSCKVVGKDEDFPEADVIVVTAIFAFEEIKEELEAKTNIKIISLEDVVYEI